MTEYVGSPLFVSGGFTRGGEIISFCLSEICGETLIDHIEKALPDYEGIYPATVQEFAKTFAQGVKYINREDDAGSRGLRISKLQYQPLEILPKHTIHIRTALNRLKKVPVVKGENFRKGHPRLQPPLSGRRAQPLVGIRLSAGLPSSFPRLFL